MAKINTVANNGLTIIENYNKLPPKQRGLARCFGGSLLFIQL